MHETRPTIATARSQGYTAALLSALFLALTGILIRQLTVEYELPVLVLAMWRNIFTSVCMIGSLLLISPRLLNPGLTNVAFLFGYSLVLTFFNLCWTFSIWLNGATVATVLIYTSTFFTVFLDRLFHRERISSYALIAATMALSGCALVAGLGMGDETAVSGIGITVAMFSGLAFGFYSISGREAARRGLNSWTTITWVFGFSAGIMLVVNQLLLPLSVSGSGNPLFLADRLGGWLLLLLLAAGPTLLGYGFYTAALVHLPSSVVNLIATLEPVFTAVIAYWYLQERLSVSQLVGSAIILAAVILVRSGPRVFARFSRPPKG